jgi:uroporphyrinogen III methyltransferase / synthase
MPHRTISPSSGTVLFVGAGPGAPDLLTIRGAEAIRGAEVVVHDRLVSPAILELVPAETEKICVDRANPSDPDPGRTTGELLVRLAAAGRRVVRLKGGDPTVFARLAEELEPLEREGVAVEFVPGITAALAAASALATPLTSRDEASSLTLVTGHVARGKQGPIDFRALATLPGTLAVYMGVEQLAEWSRQLMAAGRSGGTAVAVVSRCSWPDQRLAASTLAQCAAAAEQEGWQSPAIMIIGSVLTADRLGSLRGRRVIVTRPEGQDRELIDLLEAEGAECVSIPVIRIAEPESWEPLDAAIQQADRYDWIVFASANGVRGFLHRLRRADRDGRALGTARLAAIGPATRQALEQAGFVCDLMPAAFCSEGLVTAFAGLPHQSRFLLVRAESGRDQLRRGLESDGHLVDEVAAYRSAAVTEPVEVVAASGRGLTWLTVTSGRIVEEVVHRFGDRLRLWQIASLSPVTSAVLRRFGLEPAAEATEATAAALVAAIVERERADAPAGRGADQP